MDAIVSPAGNSQLLTSDHCDDNNTSEQIQGMESRLVTTHNSAEARRDVAGFGLHNLSHVVAQSVETRNEVRRHADKLHDDMERLKALVLAKADRAEDLVRKGEESRIRDELARVKEELLTLKLSVSSPLK